MRHDHIDERAVEIGIYLVEKRATVRQAAKHFGVSKSTAHKDVAERLRHINPEIAAKVQRVLQINKAERHLRGGYATKMKYKGRK